ncbi:MAG: hypothetical protein KGL39_56465 [Patescibacteria group bacterium]|nr:hypothetical protein [Patescibacteria group bacterium]
MAGTHAGGKKSEATIKAKYGKDFYKKLGKMGGSAKGFASEKVDKNGLTGFQRAKIYGSVAGQISRRNAAKAIGGLENEPVGQTAA